MNISDFSFFNGLGITKGRSLSNKKPGAEATGFASKKE